MLLILDSSHSMDNEFSDTFRLPAYMDDFLYPQGTFDVEGSKIGVAKSVLRQVMTNARRRQLGLRLLPQPEPDLRRRRRRARSAIRSAARRPPASSSKTAASSGSTSPTRSIDGSDISTRLLPDEYPDIQQGRFLQLGHKVMHNYAKADPPQSTGEVADIRFPYGLPVGVPGSGGKPDPPHPGTWRGAFGPKGLSQGLVIYRNPNKPGFELRMQVVSGNYGDPDVFVQVDEYGPPATPTATPSLSATPTLHAHRRRARRRSRRRARTRAR